MKIQPSILVLAAGSLGDSLFTLPALRLLQSRQPVTLAGTAPYLALGADLLGVNEVLPLEPILQNLFSSEARHPPPSQVEFWNRFSEVFVFFKEPDERLQPKLSGFPHLKAHWPHLRFEEFLKQERWAGEYWLETVGGASGGPSPAFAPPRLNLPDSLKDRGRKVCESLGVAAPFVIHPGSGSPSKNAPLSFFRKAAERITGEGGKSVLVVWGEAEERTLGEIREAFSSLPKVQVLAQPLALADLAAVLNRSCGYLGNDSGVTQLASACGAKTFAVFSVTNSLVWGPQEAIILEAVKNFSS